MLADDPGSNTAQSTKVNRCANYICWKQSNRKRLTSYRGMTIANESYNTVRSGHLSAEQWNCTVHCSCTLASRNLEEITDEVVSGLLAEWKILVTLQIFWPKDRVEKNGNIGTCGSRLYYGYSFTKCILHADGMWICSFSFYSYFSFSYVSLTGSQANECSNKMTRANHQ